MKFNTTHIKNPKFYTHTIFNILRRTGGHFVGNIIYDVNNEAQQLSQRVKALGNAVETFEKELVQNDLGLYSLAKQQPMMIISEMLAKPGKMSQAEILADIDSYGEQVFLDKKQYAHFANLDSENPDFTGAPLFNFPEGSIFGDEEFVYVGPPKIEQFIFATYIETYPQSASMNQIEKIIQELNPEKEIYAQGGIYSCISDKSVTSPLKFASSHGDIVFPKTFDELNIDGLYEDTRSFIQSNLDQVQNNAVMVTRQNYGIIRSLDDAIDVNTEKELYQF